jgi:hypothetical protein
MSDKEPFYFENRSMYLKQLVVMREKLEKEEKKSVINMSFLISIIASFLIGLTYDSILTFKLSIMAFVVEIGTVFLIAILVLQFDSLRREIKSIILDLRQFRNIFGDIMRTSPSTELEIKVLSKLYDVSKNTLDKLFEKLKTFSNTWLVVSGGIASTLLIEIFKSQTLDLYSALILMACSAILWCIAQDAYGILNYELAKKTKDLAIWWITNV